MTSNGCSNFPEERPNFGHRQVRCRGQLIVGKRYAFVNNVGGRSQIIKTITGKPHYHDDHGCVPEGYWVSTNMGEVSLQDMSVCEYESGMWNPSNWIEFLSNECYEQRDCCHHRCNIPRWYPNCVCGCYDEPPRPYCCNQRCQKCDIPCRRC